MRAARTDDNQVAVVAEVQAHGFSVVSLASRGCGVPDLLVMSTHRHEALRMALFEVKNSSRTATAQKLTRDEELFFERHRGCDIHVATSALGIVRAMMYGLCPTSDAWHCTCLETYRRKRKEKR